MIGVLLRVAGLVAIYLLVLTSVAPSDLLVGGVLALAVALGLRTRRGGKDDVPAVSRLRATAGLLFETTGEMVRGSWRTVVFCLGGSTRPSLVEIPRDGRSDTSVGLWGVLTGEAPDEVVVDVDEDRDVLIVHLVDAGDPEAVRARHRRIHERFGRKVVP